MKPFYTIQPTDIGWRTLRMFGRTWMLSDVLGYVQRIDVGKRIYLSGGILQVENQEQLKARLARERAA